MVNAERYRSTCSEIVKNRFHCGACQFNFNYDLQPSYCPECGIKFTHYRYFGDEVMSLVATAGGDPA